MTICIAALYENGKGCVLASDQMTTAHFPIGYEFENEEVKKIIKVRETSVAYLLSAGDVLFANEILEAVRKEVDEKGITAAPIIAESFRQCYQTVRKQHIIRNELEPRGLTLDTYYQAHQRLVQAVVMMIDNALKGGNPRTELIIAGFGESCCSVFSIVNPGDLFCHDAIGFAAVGSGGPHAVYSLIESGYKKSMDAKTVYELVKKAKHRSEVAPGVGRGTEIISVPEVKHV
ncbi:MAG: hypothetical protein Q8O43_06375 [Dehalococcoidia bacterium]|nr:hypothetical protein [Dehalococcoidia bacterium]